MRIEFTYCLDDFVAAQEPEPEIRRSLLRAKAIWWSITGACLMIVFGISSGVASGREIGRSLIQSLIVLAVLALFVAVNTVLRRLGRRSALQKVFAQTPDLHEPHVIEVNDDACTIITPTRRSENRWKGFHRLTESALLLRLYTDKTHFYFIPKRVFATPADLDAFRAFLLSKIPGPAHGFPVLPRSPR